jgi:endonuclease G
MKSTPLIALARRRMSARRIFVAVGTLSIAVPVTVLAVRKLLGLDKAEAVQPPLTVNNQDRKRSLDAHPVFQNVGAPDSPISVVVNDSFVTAFNRQTRTACWSCEKLAKSALKSASSLSAGGDEVTREKSSFKEPVDQPELFRPRNEDYMHSGFDRGHLVPAADFKTSQQAMDQTFSLTNIAPQVGVGFNRDYWARFEYMVRGLTKKYDDVYVCTGPAFMPEEMGQGKHYVMYRVLGSPPNVAVPTHFYKVIVATRSGTREVLDSEMKDGKATPTGEAATVSQERVCSQ